jgi:hypothetical protein
VRSNHTKPTYLTEAFLSEHNLKFVFCKLKRYKVWQKRGKMITFLHVLKRLSTHSSNQEYIHFIGEKTGI